MKRPLGLIGLVYLSALAVFFYWYTDILAIVCAAACVTASLAAVAARLIKPSFNRFAHVIACSVSILAAVLSIFLFENNAVSPVVEKYSGKEIFAEGYVCGDIKQSGNLTMFTIQTEKLEGEEAGVKVLFSTFEKYDVYPYDKLNVTITPQAVQNKQTLAAGTYLEAFDENGSLVLTGEKHISLLSKIAEVRNFMERGLKRGLSNNASGLSRAILLGEKRAIPTGLRNGFRSTGTSYLIVVSGLHLSIATFFVRRIFRRARPWLAFTAVTLFVLLFMAVTGFNFSVIRSGIMLILLYLGRVFYRQSNGINSLGIAALIICAPNPFAVGDVGMLMSFSATLGVLLWGNRLSFFIRKKLHLYASDDFEEEIHSESRIIKIIKIILRWLADFVSVSIAATLWITPVTVLFFGTISPLTVFISIAAYPAACAILLSSMLFVLLCSIPVLSIICVPLGLIINAVSEFLIFVVMSAAKIPAAQIRADEPYFYIWTAVSAGLVLTGYLVHAKRRYVYFSVICSAVILITGSCFSAIFADNASYLTIYKSGTGYTAAVNKLGNISFLSAGGAVKNSETVGERLIKDSCVDNVIITSDKLKNSAMLPYIIKEFDVSNLLLYDISCDSDLIPEEGAVRFGDNLSFTLALNSDTDLRVMTVKKKAYEFVSTSNKTVLILQAGADIKMLPEEMRTADYVLLEGIVYSSGLLNGNEYISVKKLNDFPFEYTVIPKEEFYRIPLT